MKFADIPIGYGSGVPDRDFHTKEAALVATKEELLRLRSVMARQLGETIAEAFIGNETDGVKGDPYPSRRPGDTASEVRERPRIITGEAGRRLAMSAMQARDDDDITIGAVAYFLKNGQEGPELKTAPTLTPDESEGLELYRTASVPAESDVDTKSPASQIENAAPVNNERADDVYALHPPHMPVQHARVSMS